MPTALDIKHLTAHCHWPIPD